MKAGAIQQEIAAADQKIAASEQRIAANRQEIAAMDKFISISKKVEQGYPLTRQDYSTLREVKIALNRNTSEAVRTILATIELIEARDKQSNLRR
jgi:hypothetical protein